MSWTCTMIEYQRGMTVYPDGGLKVGHMFFLPDEDRSVGIGIRFQARALSPYYYSHNKARQPVFIVVPGPTLICVDTFENGLQWQVTGTPPNITVRPSIITKDYH